jgi:hypothetical protein
MLPLSSVSLRLGLRLKKRLTRRSRHDNRVLRRKWWPRLSDERRRARHQGVAVPEHRETVVQQNVEDHGD